MVKWGMVIDLDRCTACQACTVACRLENNVPFAGKDETDRGRAIFWQRVLAKVDGKFPNLTGRFIPRPCMHCENPPCTQVCPVSATWKNEEGLVVQDPSRCIGCRYCTVACPYGVRSFNWYPPQFPETLLDYVNPDVSIRPVGVVEKCTFCLHRLQKLKQQAKQEGRALRDEDVLRMTACAQTCTGGAIYFGDLDDPNSTVSKLAQSKRAFRLLEELGTHPQVYYLMEG